MGKNKGKQKKKTDAVFKVAGHNSLKAKGRTKPVKTNLKQMLIKTRDQVDQLDEKLKGIRELLTVVKKPSPENSCKMEEEEEVEKKFCSSEEIPINEFVDKITALQKNMQIQ